MNRDGAICCRLCSFLLRKDNMKRFKEILRDPLSLLLFVLPFIYGLYYEFAAYLSGAAMALCLCFRVRQKREILLSSAAAPILMAVAYLCCLMAAFYAVDRGMAVAGFFKMLPVPLFLLLLMQYSGKERAKLLEIIPYSALGMAVLSAVLGLSEAFNPIFYSAGRLGGFFQYSNTFALYLLLGVVVLLSSETAFDRHFRIGGTFILLAGIMLTGSRSVFVLTALAVLYFIIWQKSIRRPLLILSGSLVLAGVILVFATGYAENFGRFLTIGLGESTFLGRILYWKDGLRQICSHPFGLGYMGYFYAQPSFQTGVYTVRYIHNDFLQMALDAGIAALILWVIALVISLFSKRTSPLQKRLLLLIVIGSLFDFHLQFLAVAMVLALTIDVGKPEKTCRSVFVKGSLAASGAAAVLFCYLFIAFFMAYMNNPVLALKLYPWNTDAQLEVLNEEATAGNLEDQTAMAEQILKQNRHIAEAYEVKAAAAWKNRDTAAMTALSEQALENEPYQLAAYEGYLQMLSTAITEASEQENWESVRVLAGKALEIPQRLNTVISRTDPIAYRIDDKPELTLPSEYQVYLEKLEQAVHK